MTNLLVCIRCHKYPTLVEDTISSVKWATDSSFTKIMLAVDGQSSISSKFAGRGDLKVYASNKRWGWGAGLYGLMAESISWAEKNFSFDHFLSIDYDALFIKQKADVALLTLIDSEDVGLIGAHEPDSVRGKASVKSSWNGVISAFGEPSSNYIFGEGVQGGCMLLTRRAINEMAARGMFDGNFKKAKEFVRITDDRLLPMFVRMCGLTIKDCKLIRCEWTASGDPRGLESKGIYLIHPTKLRPKGSTVATEVTMRNYFRKIRGENPLPLTLKE